MENLFHLSTQELSRIFNSSQKTYRNINSTHVEALRFALEKLKVNTGDQLADGSDLVDLLQRNCIRFREIVLSDIPNNIDYGVLMASKKQCRSVAVITKSHHLHKVSLFSEDGEISELTYSDSSLFIDDFYKYFEVYPPLPYSLSGISEFVSFVFKPYQADVLKVAIFTCLASGLQLLFPSLTVYVATHVIALGSISYAIEIGFLAILLALISTGALYLQSQYILKLEAETDKRAQVAVWDRLLKSELSLIDRFNPSDLMLRASSVSEIRSIMSSSNIASLINILFSLFYVFIMFSYMPKALGGVLPVALVFLFFVYRRAKSGGSLLTESMDVSANLSNESIEMLRLQPEIQARGIEKEFLDSWISMSNRAASLSNSFRKRDNDIEILSQSLQPICFLASFVIIVSTTTDQEWNNTSLLLRLLGFTSALSLFTSNLSNAAQTVANSVVTVIAYWQRSRPVIFTPIEPGYSPTNRMVEIDGSVSLESVSFSFKNSSTPIFQNLSLSVNSGDVVLLEMPSSSGSTSLFKLLLGIYQPSGGLISLSDTNIEIQNIANLRSQVSLAPQEPYIPPGPLGDLIDGPLTETDKGLSDFIEIVDLMELVSSLRLGLNTPVTPGGFCFSSVQRLNLSLAIALARKPRLLLIDDALRGLSSTKEKNLLLFCRSQGITVIAHKKTSTIKQSDNELYNRIIRPFA